MVKIPCPNSEALYERAKKVLPGGVSRNTILRGNHPLYASHGKGCVVVDVDGVERLDFANNMASHVHGHAFAPIVEAVSKQLEKSTAFTMGTEQEIAFGEHLCGRSNGFDKIRFVNSGTEAVMAGMKAARAFTGRTKIAKVEGSYHGAYDFAEVSQSPTPQNWGPQDRPNAVPLAQGTPAGISQEMVIIPFNEADKALDILDAHRGEIATILIDPIPHRIGMVPVQADFVSALAKWARLDGALLMFDEVITFRTELGGMQDRFDVQPDLTAMGKIIGGGFPVGALAGRNDIMDVFVRGEQGLRLPHSGTFSANPITMTAGLVAMENFDVEAIKRLNLLGDYARATLREVIKDVDIAANVTGTGSLLRIHLTSETPANYRDTHLGARAQNALTSLIEALYDEGIMMIHTGAAVLSTPMQHADIDRFCTAMHKSLMSIKGMY